MQRVRKALDPPGEARDDVEIVYELGAAARPRPRQPRAEDVWNELRIALADARGHELRAARGARRHPVAVPRRERPGRSSSSTRRLWDDDRRRARAVPGRRALDRPSTCSTTTSRCGSRPAGGSSRSTPACRRSGYESPLHVGGEAILLAPADGARYGVADGAPRAHRLAPRLGRGAGRATTRTLRPGLAFMNLHFPDEVATNVLTIDATDPKSGTAEFKATAIRLEAV